LAESHLYDESPCEEDLQVVEKIPQLLFLSMINLLACKVMNPLMKRIYREEKRISPLLFDEYLPLYDESPGEQNVQREEEIFSKSLASSDKMFST
jgi:hypothetical protein